MELRHLQALVAVAEHGSFSSAADHLGTVQSNISAHVARLERELGTTLVDRSAGRLTADGEVVVARAYRVMGELDALVADVGALREAVAGNVRVGILGTTARWLVPMLLAELAESHPRLHLVVADGTTLGLEPQLAAGRFDLAVLTFPVPGPRPRLRAAVRRGHRPRGPGRRRPLGGSRADRHHRPRAFRAPAPGTRHPVSRRDRRGGEAGRRPAAAPGRARRRAPAWRRSPSRATAPPCSPPPPSRPISGPGSGWCDVDGLLPRRVGIAQRSRGLPSAPARAVLDTLRDLMAHARSTASRRPPRARGDQRTRAEGSLRVVGMPNG